MKIIVETLTKKQIPLDVNQEDKVENIKAKIQEIEGIDPDCQNLSINGQELEDEIPIKDYPIQNNSIIRLIIRLGMKIFVETSKGKLIKLATKPLQKIKIIKEEIHEKEGILPEDQNLFFKNQKLEDDKSLLDYSIESNSTIQLSHV